jgi:PmbA protein
MNSAGGGDGNGGLLDLAEKLVAYGRSCGADEIEIAIGDGVEFSVDVRMGQVENLVEAGTRAIALRILKDRKSAFASSSDLREETVRELIRNAVRRAELANPDPFSGLPERAPVRIEPASLDLYDPEIERLDQRTKIGLATETERIALSDKRIGNSYGAGFVSGDSLSVLASSNGFLGEYRKTHFDLSVALQAGPTDDLVEDFWFSSETHLGRLDSPEKIARTAIERTVRQLAPRKIPTRRVPVIFEPLMTSGLLGFLFSCVSGTSVYQRSTYLADRLGKRIANDRITVIDDGLLPGRAGSSPFDAEGVPCRRTAVVSRGILENFLCDTYAARKLGRTSTGNAGGSAAAPNNFYLEAGPHSPEDIIRSCPEGLLLIRTLGHGLNPVTGDISRGAFGLWIEKGEIAYPVSEITISGNLDEVLNGVEMVGSDLEFRGAICGPTIKVAEMLVAGS